MTCECAGHQGLCILKGVKHPSLVYQEHACPVLCAASLFLFLPCFLFFGLVGKDLAAWMASLELDSVPFSLCDYSSGPVSSLKWDPNVT